MGEEEIEAQIEANERAIMAIEGARQAGNGAVKGSTAVNSAVNSSPLEDGRLRELVGGRGILGQAMALWWSSSS